MTSSLSSRQDIDNTQNRLGTLSLLNNEGQKIAKSPELPQPEGDKSSPYAKAPSALRPRAFLVLGPKEKTNWRYLFEKYQKDLYPDYLVRVVRQSENEDVPSCLSRENILQKWMTERSIFILSNGEKTAHVLTIQELLSNMPKIKHSPYEFRSLSTIEKPLNLRRLALTKTGVFSCLYFDAAICSGRWSAFYNTIVKNQKVYADFCEFYQGRNINVVNVVDQRSLIRNLVGIIPCIHLTKRNPSVRFSAKLDCLEQWEKSKIAIAKKAKINAGNSTAKFVISQFNLLPFEKIIPFLDLFNWYCKWIDMSPYHTKDRRDFIENIKWLLPCVLGKKQCPEKTFTLSNELECARWLRMIGILEKI